MPSEGRGESFIWNNTTLPTPSDDLLPLAAFWGPNRTAETQKAKGVGLGFCQGNRMANEDGVLLAEGRKQVYCMYFKSMKQINEAQMRALLFEAGLVDESFAKKKKKKPPLFQ